MKPATQRATDELRTPFDRGYVQVYTGDGKGKTTAAIGLAIRAVGAGLRVFLAQFVKLGQYSEIKALQCFDDSITCEQYGRQGFLKGSPSGADTVPAREGLVGVRRAIESNQFQVVILDEADVAVALGLFGIEDLLELIDAKPERVELVFTGRWAAPQILERADLVTEMKEVKHYYRNGVLARIGIEA